jgi:hypothetical protein
MRKLRTRASILGAVLAVGLAGASVAHKATIPSSVTGTAEPGPGAREVTFSGVVSSRSAKCVKGREVELYDVRTVASKIGETDADANGNWEIVAPTARLRGTQFVQIRKETVTKNSRHTHRCKRDTQEVR